MQRGAAEWEDGGPGNDRRKQYKRETDPACVHVVDLLALPEVLIRCTISADFK